MTQLETTKRICDHLEKFVFGRIWNEPYSEYRRHVTPVLLNPRSEKHVEVHGVSVPLKIDGDTLSGMTVIGSEMSRTNIRVMDGVLEGFCNNGVQATTECTPAAGWMNTHLGKILLPPFDEDSDLDSWLPSKNTMRFYVYAIPKEFFGPVKLNALKWRTLAQQCNENLLDLRVVTRSGCMLNRGYIHIKQGMHHDVIFLAVDATMYEKCMPFDRKVRISGCAGKPIPTNKNLYVQSYNSDELMYVSAVWYSPESKSWVVNPEFVDGSGTESDPYRYKSDLDYAIDDEIIVEHYFDSDFKFAHTVHTRRLTRTEVALGDIHGSYALVNGRLITGDFQRFLVTGDYVEEIDDTNIIGRLEISPEEGKTLYTGKDGKQRLLVHIPKTMNPNNLTITPNTCDIWLIPNRRVKEDAVEIQGVYVPLAEKEASIHQLTHCDFSIDASVLEGICRDHSFTNGYTIRVDIRTHDKKKFLTRDAAYIDMLYTLDDDKIVEFLMGLEPVQTREERPILDFWKASEMENTLYADALVRELGTKIQHADKQCEWCGMRDVCVYAGQRTAMTCPSFNVRSIQNYIDILGYYHVLSLIGKRMSYYRVTRSKSNQVIVTAALALSGPDKTATDFFPIVYLNGERVPQSNVRVSITTERTQRGVAELHRGEDRSIDIVADIYATRLLVSVNDIPKLTEDYFFDENTSYYHYIGTDLVKGRPGTVEEVAEGTADYVNHSRVPESTWYILTNNIKNGDYITVEMCDTDSYGQMYRFRREETPEPTELKMNTVDEWAIYKIVPSVTDIEGEPTISYEYVPEPGDFDVETKTLTLDATTLTGVDILVVEGAHVKEKTENLVVTKDSFDRFASNFYPVTYIEAPSYTQGYSYFYKEDEEYKAIAIADESEFEIAKMQHGELYTLDRDNFPLDDSILFLNGRRLVKHLDFNVSGAHETGEMNRKGDDVLCQNQLYMSEKNVLSAIRTNTTEIFSQRGFLVGEMIAWKGQVPFWFDSLSALSIDGHLCSCFDTTIGNLIVTNVKHHRNGSAYEIITAAASKVIKILNYPEAEARDRQRILEIREYFMGAGNERGDIRTIIPHSHSIHSLYIGALIGDYMKPNSSFDFSLPGERGTIDGQIVTITESNFLEQDSLKSYERIKEHDIGYSLSSEDLDYVDVYPYFHRIEGESHDVYNKLAYLISRIEPVDPVKHKEAPNV